MRRARCHRIKKGKDKMMKCENCGTPMPDPRFMLKSETSELDALLAMMKPDKGWCSDKCSKASAKNEGERNEA
jgi:hypothetical protein